MKLSHGLEMERHRAVWAQVCTNYYQPALDIARRRVGNTDDAHDAVQNATLRLLRLLPNPGRISDRKNYFFKTVQNQCNELLRKRINAANRTISRDTPPNDNDNGGLPPETPDSGRDPEVDAKIKEQNERMLNILKSHCADLTPREKQLLIRYLQGYTNAEIAKERGEDVKIIRVEMNALLAKLRYRVQHRKNK